MQAHALVAAVEPPRNLAQIRRVLRNFGIEQQQRDVADPEHPDRREEFAVDQADADGDLFAVLVEAALERKVVDLGDRVVFDLPAVAVEHLREVALAVEQPDRDQRQREIACRLQVIAGEDAEAAGEDPDAFVNAEFKRKIGDGAVFFVFAFR